MTITSKLRRAEMRVCRSGLSPFIRVRPVPECDEKTRIHDKVFYNAAHDDNIQENMLDIPQNTCYSRKDRLARRIAYMSQRDAGMRSLTYAAGAIEV